MSMWITDGREVLDTPTDRDKLTLHGDMSPEATSLRLVAARITAGFQQKDFSRLLEIPNTTYNAQEKRGAPSKKVLQYLYRTHGIDLNFILYGDMRFLPAPLQERLLEALASEKQSRDHPDS